MELKGLAIVGREITTEGVQRYILQANPDLATKGVRNEEVRKLDHPYPLAVQGLLVRNLLAIRRDFPYLFLLTNDVPDDAEVRTHLEVASGLYDKAFMERFPQALVHVDHGRDGFSFSVGPNIISRVFDIGREDITYLWPALINDCYPAVGYFLLYAAQEVSLTDLADAMEQSRSEDEFNARVLDLVDVIAYVYEEPTLHLCTKSEAVVTAIDRFLAEDLGVIRERPSEPTAPRRDR